MKQVFKTRNKQIIVEDVPAPTIEDGFILIKVIRSLISSGTETMGMSSSTSSKDKIDKLVDNFRKGIEYIENNSVSDFIRKYKNKDNISSGSGYSVSGVIVETGNNVEGFKVGDRVAAAGSGIAQHAEYVLVPKNLVVKIDDEVSYDEAAFTTVGSIALQGVRQANVQLGENVLVIGLGLLGLITVQLLKSAGCKVFGMDLYEEKNQLGYKFGMDYALNNDSDFVKDVLNKTGQTGVDAVIITAASSSPKLVNDSMKMVRKKGRVVVVGAVNMSIDRSPFYQKEVEFTISCSYGPGRYDPDYEIKGNDYPVEYVRWTENRNMESFVWLMANKKLDCKSLISHSFPMTDAAKGFSTLVHSPKDTLGVMLEYPESENGNSRTTKIDVNPEVVATDKINIGVIGTGSFAKRVYLPAIYKSSKTNLSAVASRTGYTAKKVGNEFDVKYCSTDYKEIVNDNSIDTVIIATRHNTHYPIVKEAIENGKNILVEKPLCMTFEELEYLKNVLPKYNKVVTVGHNRRYSKLSITAKEIISKEDSPVILNYRVNAGFIPPENWVHDPKEGGGRIIGESTHFYDLICYLVGSKVESMNVEFIEPNGKSVLSRDNFVATLKFENGSIANLTYSSLGHKELTKENIEILVNNKVIKINDFTSMNILGIQNKDINLKKQDKGFERQFEEFVKKIEGKPSLILGAEEAIIATELALETEKVVSAVKKK